MKIRPLSDWVLLRAVEEEETTQGGIVIPDSAKEKPSKGEVVAAGPGRLEEQDDRRGSPSGEKRFIETEVKAGQKVMFRRFGVDEIKVEGETLLMVRERDILGIL